MRGAKAAMLKDMSYGLETGQGFWTFEQVKFVDLSNWMPWHEEYQSYL